MQEKNPHLEAIHDIKQMMEKSSRFISLSGWSGVAAGVCALAGAIYTGSQVNCWKTGDCEFDRISYEGPYTLQTTLILIGSLTFLFALILAFVFTYLRSKATGVPIWGFAAKRLLLNVAIPMVAGGILIVKMLQLNLFGLVAPVSLIFYGLALINASKYTLGEIRYLGVGQLLLGIINLWMIGYGLYFWGAGFGILHIVYGIIMWNKYERKS